MAIIDDLKKQAKGIAQNIDDGERKVGAQLQVLQGLAPRAQQLMGGSCEAYGAFKNAENKAKEAQAALRLAKAKMSQWAGRGDV